MKINLKEPIEVIKNAIEENIFPGAQIFISKDENILFNDGIGNLTYDNNSNIILSLDEYELKNNEAVFALKLDKTGTYFINAKLQMLNITFLNT